MPAVFRHAEPSAQVPRARRAHPGGMMLPNGLGRLGGPGFADARSELAGSSADARFQLLLSVAQSIASSLSELGSSSPSG